LRPFSFCGYGLALLAALALVGFGAIETPPPKNSAVLYLLVEVDFY